MLQDHQNSPFSSVQLPRKVDWCAVHGFPALAGHDVLEMLYGMLICGMVCQLALKLVVR